MKRFVSLMVLVICSLSVSADKFNVNGIYYTIPSSSNNEVYVAPYSSYSGDVIIPETIEYGGKTYSVVAISNGAFANCTWLTSVTIPNSVTIIGSEAFRDCSVTSVTIGSGVKSIRDWTFNGCKNLNNITIPNSVTSIGARAFYGCSGLTSLTIPNSVTKIGGSAFAGCSGLTSLTIGSGVKDMNDRAFDGCNNLTYLTLLCHNVGRWFQGYPKLKELIFGDETTYIYDKAFKDCSALTSVTIPNSVTSIDFGTFSGCSSLASLTIPNSVTTIKGEAFYNCSGLTSVTIGSDVKTIEDKAFFGCSPQSLTFLCKSVKGWFSGTNVEEVVLGNSVNTIGYRAFYNYYKLTSLSMPNSVTSIGDEAFYDCSGLTSITIPNSVTSIGSRAFSRCHGLTSITIPKSVTSVFQEAFLLCNNLKSVTIPNSVKIIGNGAFSGCGRLQTIVSEIENPSIRTIGSNIFCSVNLSREIYPTATLVVPYGTKSAYQSAKEWSLFKNITDTMFKIDGINYIKNGESSVSVFSIDTNRDNLIIPEYIEFKGVTYSVTSIDHNAFSGCIYLNSVTIPNNVTTIGESAFYNCSGLTSVTIPNNVAIIGESAFFGCSSLSSVTIGSGVKSIGDKAFFGCRPQTLTILCNKVESWFSPNSTLRKVVLGNNVTEIGEKAFYNCSGLTSLTIGSGVKSIGKFAFYNCSGLTSLTIPNNVTIVGMDAFTGCTGLITLSIGKGVNYLSSFRDCNNLNSLTLFCPFIQGWMFEGTPIREVFLGNTVKLIGNGAFKDCKNLTSIILPNNVTHIYNSAFQNCSSLASLTIGNRVQSIGASAFYGCSSLNSVISLRPSALDLSNVFDNITFQKAVLKVPRGSIDSYKRVEEWKYFNNIVEINPPIKGDVNCDGILDFSDIENISEFVMGYPFAYFNKLEADYNEDGDINIADIVLITSLLTGDIVGVWECTSAKYEGSYELGENAIIEGHTLQFFSDGTCYSGKETGRWSLKDNILTLQGPDSKLDWIIKGLSSKGMVLYCEIKFKSIFASATLTFKRLN